MKIAHLVVPAVAWFLNLNLLAQEPAAPGVASPEPAPESSDKQAAEIDGQAPAGSSRIGGGAKAGPGAMWIGAANRTPASQVSVLCFKEPDQKELHETTEDIAVLAFLLSRNLDQAVPEPTADYKLGVHMLLAGNQTVGASYIQDFGALLKMQVRFPLAPPADGRVEREPAQTSSQWEVARQEVLDQDSGNDYFPPASNFNKRGGEGHPYDPALVQALQKRILVLLKNAANIRHLQANESIIVKVVGTPSFSMVSRVADDQAGEPGEPSTDSKPAPSSKKSSRHGTNGPRVARADAIGQNQTTVLTVRVKKSDIDAYAAGSMSQEQFIKSAQVAAYFNPAPNDGDSRNIAYDGARR